VNSTVISQVGAGYGMPARRAAAAALARSCCLLILSALSDCTLNMYSATLERSKGASTAWRSVCELWGSVMCFTRSLHASTTSCWYLSDARRVWHCPLLKAWRLVASCTIWCSVRFRVQSFGSLYTQGMAQSQLTILRNPKP
jgi:hypothetical protein